MGRGVGIRASTAVGSLCALALWGCALPQPAPSVDARRACPGVLSALEAADHLKAAAAALAAGDIEMAVASARRADAAATRGAAEGRAIPDTEATRELRAQLAKLDEA